MAVTVRIPAPLRRITGGLGLVEASGGSVGELFEKLEETYPGIKERLFDGDGSLRRFVNVYVNQEDIRFLQGLDTSLKDGDEVSIIPAIAGGSLLA